MSCRFLGKGNACTGMYQGFACIGDRCAYLTGGANDCAHLVSPSYCKKTGKFKCAGPTVCEHFAGSVK
ncbi:MAG: hypothetical protein HZB92_02775 [Euryarchaeota archaeon]|nr:hypothetical protein [Euryarchaeota archaeon]